MAKILYSDFTSVLNAINAYRNKAGVANKTAADFDVVQNQPAKWSTITKLDEEYTYEESILKTGCSSHYTTYKSSHDVTRHATYYASYNSGKYTHCSHLAGNNASNYTGHLGSYKNSHYTYKTYYSGYNNGYNSTKNTHNNNYCRSA